MTQTFTALDDFQQNPTPHGSTVFHGEYLRYKPWTGSQSIGGGHTTYSITGGVGTFTNAYQGVAEGASILTERHYPLIDSRASFCSEAADSNDDYLYGALWRRGWVLDGTVSTTCQFLEYSSTAANSLFRWVGLCARASGQTLSESAGSEHLVGGDGYWLLWCNTGANRNWKLVRLNAGVPTVLASQVGPASPVSYWAERRTIVMRVRTVGSAVVITCQTAAPAGPPMPLVPSPPPTATLFRGNVSDTSASRITTPGRWGFGGSAARGGLVMMHEYWKLQSEDIGNTGVLMNDYWDRSGAWGRPTHKNGSSGGDGNGVTGRSLMTRYTGDCQCDSAISTRALSTTSVSSDDYLCVQDVAGTAKYALDSRPSTSPYTARRTAKWYKNGSGSSAQVAGILLRGTYSASAVHESKLSDGYFLRLTGTTSPDAWQADLYILKDSFGGSGARLIATASLGPIADYGLTNNASTIDFQLLNTGPSAPASGDPQITVKLNGVAVGSTGRPPWVASYVDGGVTVNTTTGTVTLSQSGSGTPPGVIQSGSVEGMYLGAGSGGLLSCALNDWADLAPDFNVNAKVEHLWAELVIRPSSLNAKVEHLWAEYVVRPSGLNALVEHLWVEYVVQGTHNQSVTGITAPRIRYHPYSPAISGALTVSVSAAQRIRYHPYTPVVELGSPPERRAPPATVMKVMQARLAMRCLRAAKATLG